MGRGGWQEGWIQAMLAYRIEQEWCDLGFPKSHKSWCLSLPLGRGRRSRPWSMGEKSTGLVDSGGIQTHMQAHDGSADLNRNIDKSRQRGVGPPAPPWATVAAAVEPGGEGGHTPRGPGGARTALGHRRRRHGAGGASRLGWGHFHTCRWVLGGFLTNCLTA